MIYKEVSLAVETPLVKNKNDDCCVRLWQSVLLVAFKDAMNRKESYHRRDAIHFIVNNKKDFNCVSILANFNPDYLREKMMSKLKEKGII
jgi:hypothetical protein